MVMKTSFQIFELLCE